MSDNVVKLAARFAGGAPIERKPRDWSGCRHGRTLIDQDRRTVSCRDCGQDPVDAFEVLLGLALTWERWQREYERLTKARQAYDDHDREVWERKRDRHLGANPSHAATLDPSRRMWDRSMCRTCTRIEQTCPQSVREKLRQAMSFEGAPPA